MKTIPKDHIEKALGKNGFSWFPKNLTMLTYLQGIPEMDELQEAKPAVIKRDLTLTALPGGLEFRTNHNGKGKVYGIPYAEIKSASIEAPEDVVTNTDRSVIGRAVVGGLLLGPVGALVGGMSGLQQGKKVESKDLIITFQIEQDGIEHLVVTTAPKRVKVLIDKFFKKDLPPLAPHIEIIGL